MNGLKTKEVARLLGVSRETVLRYEKRGLLPEAGRNPFNNYRVWPKEEIERLADEMASLTSARRN